MNVPSTTCFIMRSQTNCCGESLWMPRSRQDRIGVDGPRGEGGRRGEFSFFARSRTDDGNTRCDTKEPAHRPHNPSEFKRLPKDYQRGVAVPMQH